jgi:hypothetical protein
VVLCTPRRGAQSRSGGTHVDPLSSIGSWSGSATSNYSPPNYSSGTSRRGIVLGIAGRNQRRLSREAPRVVKLKHWNGATGHTGPKTQSPWPGPRMPRCMVGSRNTQRQTHRRDGDCGLGRYHASSFGAASSLRQISGVLGTVAATGYTRR